MHTFENSNINHKHVLVIEGIKAFKAFLQNCLLWGVYRIGKGIDFKGASALCFLFLTFTIIHSTTQSVVLSQFS